MRSTPMNVLLPKSGESPLEFRLSLAIRFVSKIVFILTLATEFQTLNLWKQNNNKKQFLDLLNKKFTKHDALYTDGYRTRYGIFTQEGEEVNTFIPNYASLCDAEMFAIMNLCNIFESMNYSKYIIITDSKSATQNNFKKFVIQWNPIFGIEIQEFYHKS